jgi:PAS domain S-box-containing protein
MGWPTAVLGLVIIKAFLSLALKPTSLLFSYSALSYLLLLLFAIGFAIRNGIQNTQGSRLFWAFFTIACFLWALDQWLYLYYQLILKIEVPTNSIADALLFLHVASLLAAAATLPHRKVPYGKPYLAILNSLLVLFFWTFLYAYSVFPYQYLYSTFSYAWRFDLLYFVESLVLILALGILSLRVAGPWRSIYLHLLGASTLYGFSSAVANLAIDSGGYLNGKLYGLGLTASVCWFVWIPLRARQLPVAEVKEQPDFDRRQGTVESVWPLVAVLLISIPIAWELFQREANPDLRTLRLIMATVAFVCLATVVYIKEHFARRELVSRVGVVNDQLHLAMQAGSWVGWDLDVKSGRDLWFGDLEAIFEIPATSYVATVERFIGYVHPDDRKQVSEALAEAKQKRRPYRQEFRVMRVDGTIRWLAARGKFYFSANGDPERMVGVSLDITERKLAEEKLREYEKAVEGSEEMIAVVDRDYRYLIANRKFLRLRNMTKEQVVGHFAHEVLNNGVFETVVKPKLDECFEGKVVRFEMKYTYPVLGERDVLISYFPIQGAAGIDRVACIVHDITEHKQLEKVLAGMSGKLIEAQEQERARIARELHDDINQRLALLAVEIEQVEQHYLELPVEIRNRMRDLRRCAIEISSDVHNIAYELHSANLEYLGIAASIRSFCKQFAARQVVKIDFVHDEIPRSISPEVSLCFFRVLQEALRNALQHSQVRQFEVKLCYVANQLHLAISDHGIGFDSESAMTKGGLGLISMRERVRLVNGTIDIDSKPMDGTTIHVRVPLTAEKVSEALASTSPPGTVGVFGTDSFES